MSPARVWPTANHEPVADDGRSWWAIDRWLQQHFGYGLSARCDALGRSRWFRPFAEAREFARSLGLNSVDAWRDYCTSGRKPADIPANPASAYTSEFNGYFDWLGAGQKKGGWRPFAGARDLARSLALTCRREWWDYCKSGKKPEDVPAVPENVYPEFSGYGDWLGTGLVANWQRRFRPFREGRAFARALHLTGMADWKAYTKSGRLPPDIPVNPAATAAYKPFFKGWADWLGYESHTRHAGERNGGGGKLTWARVDRMRRLRRDGVGSTELSRMFGVSTTMVKNILSGRAWRPGAHP